MVDHFDPDFSGDKSTIHYCHANMNIILSYRTMNTRDKKDKGDEGENLVAMHYQNHGHTLLQKKYKIQDGELDLIFENDDFLTFVEVKVVDHIDDLFDYITPKKLGTVKRTIERYLLKHPTEKPYVLDVVFVRDNSILEVHENVTNT